MPKKSAKKSAKKAVKKPAKKTSKPVIKPVVKKPKPIKRVSDAQESTPETEATTTDAPVVKAVLDPSGAVIMAPVEYKS